LAERILTVAQPILVAVPGAQLGRPGCAVSATRDVPRPWKSLYVALGDVIRVDRKTRSRGLVLTVMCTGYFLVLLDVTVVNVALPRIGSGLGASVAGLQWIVDGYSLPLAALLLASGTLGDRLGHKRVVLAGMLVFAVASLCCALAPVTGVLIAARAVQGIGAALLLPGTLAIISRAYSGHGEQARAIGVWAGVGSIALPAGPLLGGMLVEGLGWRWVFAINVPIVVFAAVVALLRVPAEPGRDDLGLDPAGTALVVVGLAGGTFAIIQAGHSGFSAAVAAGAVVAIVSFAGLVVAERRAANPLLPPGLFRRPAFAGANSVAGCMNLGTLGLLFLLTLFLQTVQHRSPLLAGLAVLPFFLPLSLLAPVAGRLVGRIGPEPVIVAGLALAAAGVGMLATWEPRSSYVSLLPAMLCWGIGLAALTPAVVAAAIAAIPASQSGLASGVNNTARQAGGAIGIAVYGAVAGQPSDSHFISGLHVTGLSTAALFTLAALATVALIPRGRPHTGARQEN
jgi:MFS transporter, DHA2 family, methylenomycin A resistance protein